MFYNYRKLCITKELKNYTKIDCIIINQNILDFATAEMIIEKGIKKVINCVDYVYITNNNELMANNSIDILYLPAMTFTEFDSFGIVDIGRSSVSYNKKNLIFSTPEKKPIESLIKGFVWNTIEYMEREKELINSIEISGHTRDINDVCIIISRGEYGKEDIRYARKIIKEENASIICVDGGCDTALNYRLLPDIIVGDMDSISRKAIELCDNFIIHSYLNGFCPGLKRIPESKRIGLIKCFGTSEDAAILYCIEKGSSRIYTLGFHTSAPDNMEKGRKGMSSTLLIRLYYGHIIKDIKQQPASGSKMLYLVSSAAVILIILYFSFFINLTMKVFK